VAERSANAIVGDLVSETRAETADS
jgi:hypothetical protein